MLITLKKIVSNSSSNLEGLKLFNALEEVYGSADGIVIEIDKDSSLSSSFLNSSIGLFMEKHGVDAFKENVKIKGSRSQFNRIVDYLNKFSSLSTTA